MIKLLEFHHIANTWEINPIKFQDVNLLVGKNAVGKSKTIDALSNAVSYLLQTKELDKYSQYGFNLIFQIDDEWVNYAFAFRFGLITKEILRKRRIGETDEEILLNRDENQTVLHSESINPPADKLTLHVRRDTLQYPYFEKIMQWAENVCGHRFNELDSAGDYSTRASILQFDRNLQEMVKELSSEAKDHIIEQANKVGYPIEKIDLFEPASDLKVVIFQEKNIPYGLTYFNLSKGMFRTLYLLIYIEYLAAMKKPTLLLVDDLCEGLDYDRSIQLGRLLFEFCLENQIQLIASSNDSFLMDVVDLRYWTILQREGNIVNAINILSHPQLFEDFQFTGLNNFDLFSSDFIARHLTVKGDE